MMTMLYSLKPRDAECAFFHGGAAVQLLRCRRSARHGVAERWRSVWGNMPSPPGL